jgi:hypothetical protein
MRKSIAVIAISTGIVVCGAVPAFAAGANINPNSQTASMGNAHYTTSWSGGSPTFYPSSDGSLGHFTPSASFSYGFNSCLATHTYTQELDVLSGGNVVAAATSTTLVPKTNPC